MDQTNLTTQTGREAQWSRRVRRAQRPRRIGVTWWQIRVGRAWQLK